MKEIFHNTSKPLNSSNETLASQILVEIYDRSILETSRLPANTNKGLGRTAAESFGHTTVEPFSSTTAKPLGPAANKSPGHSEDESMGHIAKTWSHVKTGKYTNLELLECGLELAGAIALFRYGMTRVVPLRSASAKPALSSTDDTILSQTLKGAHAHDHPVMRVHIRTRETPTFNIR